MVKVRLVRAGMRQREALNFRTPQHPSLGSINWGGASPLLARNIPKESLEQKYLRINSIRTRDEIFPANDDFNYLPQTYTPKYEVPQTPSRRHKGILLKFLFPEEENIITLGSNSNSNSKRKRWFPRWDPKNRWPKGVVYNYWFTKPYMVSELQVIPLLQCQNLYGYVDGSTPMPSAATDLAGHNMWKQLDQLVMSLLLSSLTEEALSITIGFTTSRDVWNSLETTFSQKSKARELQIKDELHLMKRGSCSISEYSRIFKAHCDQLSAMGRPVEDTDKVHWYLRGLGHEFSTFSITQLSLTPIPSFKDIVPKAESFDLFSKSIDQNTGVPAYIANFSPASSHRSDNTNIYQHKYKGGPSRGGHRNKQNYRRPPRCQICREEGHYATDCNRRYIKPEATRYIKPDANLAEALTHCTIHDEPADWYTDTGASAHMTADASQLDKVEPYTGKDKVVVGNGSSLPITYTGSCSPTPHLQLNDVLVVPRLTKNLLSVSKLTRDYPLSVSFTDNDFIIQNLHNQRVVASGKHVDGLYVLKRGHQAFSTVLAKSSLCNSFAVWHARLGHVSSSIISILNKQDYIAFHDPISLPPVMASTTSSAGHSSPSSVSKLRVLPTTLDLRGSIGANTSISSGDNPSMH
ncbi:hypothetical protein POTOM_009495 [Populus tomentosa]|uniref:Retrovirus-related Pol polyprotein from transposon TNT 1-94-like beta-barrel domain-containing protein n=2 Tax=Populus TaxID=3689 RepID=A0A8X8ABI6_POPTO|nr:hypothetical protein POTOM_009495 [Populus tomentosa]